MILMSEGWLWCLYCAAGGFWDLRPFLSWTSILISKNWAPINFSTFILRYRIITSNKKRHLTFEIIYRKKSFRIRDFFSSMRNWWKNPCLRSNPFFLVSETKNPRQMIVKSPGLDHLNVFSYIYFSEISFQDIIDLDNIREKQTIMTEKKLEKIFIFWNQHVRKI